MCEYSNAAEKTRKAAQGDRVVVASVNQGCVGFADMANRGTSVCMIHGTELAFDTSIKFLDKGGVEIDTKVRTARFVETDPEHKQSTFSDALVIKGQPEPVHLVGLSEGQLAKVLQLPVNPSTLKGEGAGLGSTAVRELEHAGAR